MPTLTTSPVYPVPGQKVQVTFSALNAATTHVVLTPLLAPVDSELREQIDQHGARVEPVFNELATNRFDFEPDKGGVYTFTLREEQRSLERSKRHEKDTQGSPNPTVVATSTVTISIGEELTLQVGTGEDVTTLRLFVWGDSIRATTLEQHGIATPVLDEPQSQAAENAAIDSSVVSALEALSGQTATTVLGSFNSDFEAVRDNCNTHFSSAVYHTNSDALRSLGDAYTADSIVAAEKSVNELWARLNDHMLNVTNLDDSVDPPFPATHQEPDGTTYLITQGASSTRASQYMALADILVALEVHKDVSDAHLTDDSSASVAGSLLLQVFSAYVRALRASSPASPPEQNSARALLVHFGGFTAV